MDEQQLVERLKSTPPSYLQAFRLTPGEMSEWDNDEPHSAWRIGCRCGGNHGALLGYRLQRFVPDYSGLECFVGPLAFACDSCEILTEILDTDRHGYHAEVGVGGTKYRGEGRPDRYACPNCRGEHFSITVGFEFWDPDELLREFGSAWENLFNVFYCDCTCTRCGTVSQPTQFGKL